MADFDVVVTGVGNSTGVQLIAHDHSDSLLPKITVPVDLPPILKTQEEELEELLCCPQELPIHDSNTLQQFLPREPDPSSLFAMNVMPAQSTLGFERNPANGELQTYREVPLKSTGATAKNSWSLSRRPGPASQGVRGSSTNYPFWPGGLDEPNIDDLAQDIKSTSIDLDSDLLTVPPGFESGVEFQSKSVEKLTCSDASVLNLGDLLTAEDEILLEGEEEEETQEEEEENVTKIPDEPLSKVNLDEIIKLENRIDEPETEVKKTEEASFAIVEDVKTPVTDFYKRVPNMAHKWDFELDNFQKLAILHLENHENVFVAAHTSAGKTVVAEYAIALSMRHMMRTIYTSPIKALSNQKYHDFKKTFGDVGLITGDVQIHPESSCLIMTTEILRSMLYNGSDVIRDLEWVIFDEVHYINDAERGVVWEEVLIMLPQHVNIILLSATVPNTREFADWVGRTKKRPVYVVSTTKRPVPLEHYLYTGNSTKTSNELFMLMDAEKNFLMPGYNKALTAKKERATKASQSFGAKGARQNVHSNLDKNIWLSIIEMLRKKEKMPVVAFTLSKKKIDDNAHHMTSVDLTSQSEKSEIHIFFQKCVSRLKGSDVNLPQVKFMGDLLRRGIGVHHSGILPILKEVVEMLFQRGLVKVLFATETFAMGVNMPARTVVFDSIRKHDGTQARDLLPGEYIQMAGRAGRRGLDTTGTVIILCKGDVPEMSDLHKMMLGKPTILHSQFRLTYSMILNLLRVEQLRVEDMMKRSFSEFHTQRDAGKRKEALEALTEEMHNMQEVVDCSGDLYDYYKACDEYFKLRAYVQKVLLSHPVAIKSLSPGRVVVLDNATYRNAAAFVLKVDMVSKERSFTVLTLKTDNDGDDEPCISPRPVDLHLYRPDGVTAYEIVTVKGDDIICISTKTCRIAADKIIDNHKKRQIPRFRDDPPSESVTTATQELLRIIESNSEGLENLDPINDLKIRDIDMVDDFQRIKFLESRFCDYNCVHEPNFSENFARMRANVKLKEEYNNLKFLLSDESLSLLPEYQQRIEVLRQLNYIDSSNTVQLKGRVACEISNQELIITELVFENALTSLQPAEIASLLSSVVFEMRRASEPNLEPNLVQAKERLLKMATSIGELQKSCGVPIPVDDYVATFHFNLMEVVYEWARGMPFADLMKLTDVQEGIIVRCIQRLDEVLKDVRNAARIIGDPVLYQKMEEASQMIKRDIVFAASLYMS